MAIKPVVRRIQFLALYLLLAPTIFAADEIIGTTGDDTLQGTSISDDITGGKGDDILIGGDGDDELNGEDGDDILIGGAGIDRLYGGLGSDLFIIDISTLAEPDEIMDFRPEDGDGLLLDMSMPGKLKKKDSSKLELDGFGVDFKKAGIDKARISSRGDVEVRFRGRGWLKVVGVRRSDLKVKLTQKGSRLGLIFSGKF